MAFGSVVEWFSQTANALAFSQLVAASVTAVATIALWRVTRVLADETKTLAAMTSQPFVVGALESVPGISAHNVLSFVLRNTGNATAFDVKARICPSIPKVANGTSSPNDETLFEISLIPPGQALSLQGVVLDKVHDKSFELTIGWASRPGAESHKPIKYSIHGKDLPNEDWNVKGLHSIAEELTKLRKHLEKQ